MKFTVDTYCFKEAMEKAYKCVDKKFPMSILQNLLFHIEEGNSYVAGTNLDNWVISNISVKNVSGKTDIVFGDTESLLKAMKFFKDGDVLFDVQNNKVIICCGGKQTSQILLDKEDFLEVPVMGMEDAQSYKYSVQKLKERFNLIKYAAYKDDARPILRGVHFRGSDMVSLDGYRMAINTSSELDVIVPFTAQTSSLSLVTDVLDEDVSITVNHANISVSDGDTMVIGRLLDGDYFNYKTAIPDYRNEVQIKASEYSETLKYFKAFKKTHEKNQIVAWFNSDLMLAENNACTDNRVKIRNFNGNFKNTIGFNNQFMLDAMTQFKAEDLRFSITGSADPIIIRDDNGNLALVLPVRLEPEVSELMQELE